jgi:hypothetical protein
MVAAGLTIFNGCQKSDELIDQGVDEQAQLAFTDPMFTPLNEIYFSVEDNRLVFESEREFQKCIDFLAQLGDENFSKFEEAVGFKSLRQSSAEDIIDSPIDDELLSTLLNPEMQIIVEHYLLSLDAENEIVKSVFLGENMDLKNANSNLNALEYSFSEDVFAQLKGEAALKSIQGYCSGNEIEYSYPDFIKANVQYKNYGIYHRLKARIWNDLGSQYTLYYMRLKTVDSPYNPPTVPSGITSRCFWKNKNDQENFDRDFYGYTTWEVDSRPYSSTRRLKGYRFDVDFTWQINSWSTIATDNISIECHEY